MTAAFPYATAAAFRAALKAIFSEIAKTDPRFTVDELQRQFAYDRVLSRCFSADDAELWILKGAGALLARLPIARHSKDIDLFYTERASAPDDAVSALTRNLDRDLGDHFRFEITRITSLQERRRAAASTSPPTSACCTPHSTSTSWSTAHSPARRTHCHR